MRNHLLPIWAGVKHWFLLQREQGNFVDREDLFLEYTQRVSLFVEKLQAHRDACKPLTSLDVKALKAGKLHLQSCALDHPRFAKNKWDELNRLMDFIACRVCKPQRLVDLSKDEERRRLHQTWKLMDERISLAAFGTEAQLSAHVGDPASWVEHR